MGTISVPHCWKYDAFVSFRGEDIRKNFVDHLFTDFRQKGINAFKDDQQLSRGEVISHQLFKAIEESRFLIVIFSKNYASSSWCLRELVKILECKELGEHKHKVRIIFYDVKPDVVRHQTESYAEAFSKHGLAYETEEGKWMEALRKASNLAGWELQDMANGYESRFIDKVSKEILKEMSDGPLHVGENLVGLDARLENMKLERFIGSNKVHMIGICGIGGIGKTTLVKTIYNLIYDRFERYHFCENVKEASKQHGLAQVLMQVIDGIMKTRLGMLVNVSEGISILKKRVAYCPLLLVLDDVDHSDQLQALAGSPNWFCPGSLIIFTSKDRQLLNSNKVDEIYDMVYLDYNEAFELFSLHAFYEKSPSEDFKKLSDEVVRYVQGHPLALRVLGGFLYKKTMREWRSELDKLQVYPNAEIQQVLRLSYDGLDPVQKSIFLDIASTFIGVNINSAASVLDSYDSFAYTNIKVLEDKSLITTSMEDNSLRMHDLIQAMAREIVREESPTTPGSRSRLWILSEVCDVLSKNKATQKVEVLVLLLEKSSRMVHIDCKSFTSMKNLRILNISDMEMENLEHGVELGIQNDSQVNYSGSLEHLSNELRLFYWHGYPFSFLPSDFYPENIVAIDMSYSNIKSLWATPMGFKSLKVIKLRHCHKLTNTPDFTNITNLEELSLEGCINLLEVHASVGKLEKLFVLNMSDCIRLRSFPCTTSMHSLEVLILSGCVKINKLPNVLGSLKNLVELLVDRTGITALPSFLSPPRDVLAALTIGEDDGFQSRGKTSIFSPSAFLRKLQQASSFILPSFGNLRSLKHLDVSYCNISEVSHDSIGGLAFLQHLNLSGNNFTSLPDSLSRLSRLTRLGLVGCKKLEVLPQLPPKIAHFDAIDCTALQELDKQRVTTNKSLSLDFSNCPNLVHKHSTESIIDMYLPEKCDTNCTNVHIFLQASRIPAWFTNQSPGNSVTVELPPQWYNSKFKRYGVCVAFRPKNNYFRKGSELKYYVRNFDGGEIDFCYNHLGTPFSEYVVKIDGSDMIWLHYFKPRKGWKTATNFVTISFISEDDIVLKECGVRLICEDGDDNHSAAPQSSHERITEITEDEPSSKKIRIE